MESMDIKARIAAQKAELEKTPSDDLNVVVGGEITKLTITKIRPDEWQLIARMNPPRAGVQGDKDMDVNLDALPLDYPVDRIRVDGEPVDAATWREIYAVLDSFHKQNVGVIMWDLNVYATVRELLELGKALAGRQSTSPAV